MAWLPPHPSGRSATPRFARSLPSPITPCRPSQRLAYPFLALLLFAFARISTDAELPPAFPPDPLQSRERTCFQTGQAWSENGNLRSDVAIVYGIDPGLPDRIRTWRDRGYRIHVMTGVSWGHYQDYLYGRFDGVNHEDEAQTDRNGKKISHGGDVYYMSPGANFGKFLCLGVQRALDAGAEAIHLEEPEFWVRGGYSEGFKREWKSYYGEDWQPPHASADAQWRASKLKYHLYRRALQQVFDHVQAFNRSTGKNVRCYVPTHSLINYAHWRIVSPESSLAQLQGCDGYIAQVWTGTSRTPNRYRGVLQERTFETAFLEYGAMQNLVRATGRTVWYLNDPIEDDPKRDWDDYRRNWESTLVASLLQPEVWRFEVAPWPERVFGGRYPAGHPNPQPIPPAYAAEVQTVCNSLNYLDQPNWSWDSGTPGLGVVIGDSLMFQRGDPSPSDPHLSHFYGLALPLLKRGLPVIPVQLENLPLPNAFKDLNVLLLSYHGLKPLSPEVHPPIASWVKAGGVLLVCDDDSDPYARVRDWWNSGSRSYPTPRHHLFEALGLEPEASPASASEPAKIPTPSDSWIPVGRGFVRWLRANPASLAADNAGDLQVARLAREAVERSGRTWHETAHLLLRRGPYVIAAGLDESITAPPKSVPGRFVNLFDPDLNLRIDPVLSAGDRWFLLDVATPGLAPGTNPPVVLASSFKALPLPASSSPGRAAFAVEGVARTPAIGLLRLPGPPKRLTLADQPLSPLRYSEMDQLCWIRFENSSAPRTLVVEY